MCLRAAQEALQCEAAAVWVKKAEAVVRVAALVMAAPLEIVAQVEMA